jgi:hypothetical protein
MIKDLTNILALQDRLGMKEFIYVRIAFPVPGPP